MKITFSKLTSAQKRVAIAKDAIAQIRLKKYRPREHHYMTFLRWHADDVFSQEVLTQEKQPVCKVCQLGAALCSAIRLGNTFELPPNSGNETPILKALKKWFSVGQIVLMEAAFEQFFEPPTYRGGIASSNREKAVRFGEKYKSVSKRQIAIFENIIENNGTFKP